MVGETEERPSARAALKGTRESLGVALQVFARQDQLTSSSSLHLLRFAICALISRPSPLAAIVRRSSGCDGFARAR